MSYNITPLTTELTSISEWLRKEYSQISTGRANPALLDSVMVDSYGTMQPVKNIASMNNEDPRTLRIVPWDKSQIKDIERAIHESGLPLALATDAEGLRASIPQLTSENKVELVKLLKDKLEQARVKIRNERQKADKEIDSQAKAGDFGDDEKFSFKEKVQKAIDDANKQVEKIFETKEADIKAV